MWTSVVGRGRIGLPAGGVLGMKGARVTIADTGSASVARMWEGAYPAGLLARK